MYLLTKLISRSFRLEYKLHLYLTKGASDRFLRGGEQTFTLLVRWAWLCSDLLPLSHRSPHASRQQLISPSPSQQQQQPPPQPPQEGGAPEGQRKENTENVGTNQSWCILSLNSMIKLIRGFVLFFYSPGGKNSQNRKLTDFYPTRRSSRKSKTELKVGWVMKLKLWSQWVPVVCLLSLFRDGYLDNFTSLCAFRSEASGTCSVIVCFPSAAWCPEKIF